MNGVKRDISDARLMATVSNTNTHLSEGTAEGWRQSTEDEALYDCHVTAVITKNLKAVSSLIIETSGNHYRPDIKCPWTHCN